MSGHKMPQFFQGDIGWTISFPFGCEIDPAEFTAELTLGRGGETVTRPAVVTEREAYYEVREWLAIGRWLAHIKVDGPDVRYYSGIMEFEIVDKAGVVSDEI